MTRFHATYVDNIFSVLRFKRSQPHFRMHFAPVADSVTHTWTTLSGKAPAAENERFVCLLLQWVTETLDYATSNTKSAVEQLTWCHAVFAPII